MWKVCGKKLPWPALRYLSHNWSGGTLEIHEKINERYLVYRPRFEPGIFLIRRSINRSTATFDYSIAIFVRPVPILKEIWRQDDDLTCSLNVHELLPTAHQLSRLWAEKPPSPKQVL
jgi:hypothetical protein